MSYAREGTGEAEAQTSSRAAAKAQGEQFRWEKLLGCWATKTPLRVTVTPLRSRKRGHADSESDRDDDSANGLPDAKRPCQHETLTKSRAQSVASATSLPGYTS